MVGRQNVCRLSPTLSLPPLLTQHQSDPANIAMNDMGRTGISFTNLLSVPTQQNTRHLTKQTSSPPTKGAINQTGAEHEDHLYCAHGTLQWKDGYI